MTPEQQTQIKELLTPVQSVVISIPPQPSLDIIAASHALVVALQQLGKEVLFASPQPLPEEAKVLTGLAQVKTELGNQNLTIAFDYSETSVDKVSYHIGEETGKFYLTVKPQPGQKPLDASQVEFTYSGLDADAIILVGVQDLESLDQLYFGNEQAFKDVPVLSFTHYQGQAGQVNVDLSDSLNLSAGMAQFLRDVGWSVTSEVATNILYVLEEDTQRFSSLGVTPAVLELAAWLMRLGGRRLYRGEGKSGGIETNTERGTEPATPLFSQALKNPRPKKTSKKKADPVEITAENSEEEVTGEPAAGGLDYQPSGFGPGGNG